MGVQALNCVLLGGILLTESDALNWSINKCFDCPFTKFVWLNLFMIESNILPSVHVVSKLSGWYYRPRTQNG